MTKPLNTQELCGTLDERRGYNMNTVSGLPVWPKAPRAEDIRIEDISGALSRICRYNGHLRDLVSIPFPPPSRGSKIVPVEIYSVAQHSVLVEQYVRAYLEPRSDYSTFTSGDPRKLLLAALPPDRDWETG